MKTWLRELFFKGFALQGIHPVHIDRSMVIARLYLGLLLTHKYVDTLGFTPLCDPRPHGWFVAWIGCIAGVCLTLGLLTPLSVIVFGLIYIYHPPTGSLGEAVLQVVLWALLLFGAGTTFSLDARLRRHPLAQRLLDWLYMFSLRSPRELAWGRFFVLFMFWGICVNAMSYHVRDMFWLQGSVLQVGFVTPYLCDHYQFANDVRQNWPGWYVAFCTVGLLVQSFWEFFLIPLMLSRLGRLFVFAQGLMFFTASTFLLNLQYLPVTEFGLWMMLFGPVVLDCLERAWKGSSRTEPLVEAPAPACAVASSRAYPAWAAVALGIVLVSVQVVTLPGLAPKKWANALTGFRGHIKGPERVFGQVNVDVFNATDMQLGSVFFVLYELDEDGQPKRVVPFLDSEGGRLRYLRNDLLYFKHSLPWQRSALADKFENEDWSKPSVRTMKLIQLVAALDAGLTQGAPVRHYEARFFQRTMNLETLPNGWTGKSPRGKCSLTLDVAQALQGISWSQWIFDVPPGQFRESKRMTQTWRSLF